MIMSPELLQKAITALQALTAALSDLARQDAAQEEPISMERLRGRLAEISRNGKTAEIRKIFKKYGAEKLSDIDPASYNAILKDAEELENAT